MSAVTTQAVARRWMHDLVCLSETCQGDDHAKRTQSRFAAHAVRTYKDGAPLAPVVHEHSCLGCGDPENHIARLGAVAEDLRQRLGLVANTRGAA